MYNVCSLCIGRRNFIGTPCRQGYLYVDWPRRAHTSTRVREIRTSFRRTSWSAGNQERNTSWNRRPSYSSIAHSCIH